MAWFPVLRCDGFEYEDALCPTESEAVPAQVGSCVEIESSHPAFYVKGVVECG